MTNTSSTGLGPDRFSVSGFSRDLVKGSFARDLPASIVVFLVALPLCMGIAVASGAPPAAGLVTGIVGGVVVGALAGSPLQVSGPAAGLAVIVFDIIEGSGIGALGPILMLAGLIQFLAGAARLGQWFRAISPAVVHGMLAGIGVLIVAGQLHVMLDARPHKHGYENLVSAPAAYLGLLPIDGQGAEAPLFIGLVTIASMVAWERFRPRRLKLMPGALVAIAAATVLASAMRLPVAHVAVPPSLFASLHLPAAADLADLLHWQTLTTALAVAFIASAETLLSAAAVDGMHNGVRTRHDKELRAQGIGNLICGLVGALPMTGVIVRSSANVQAGAATRASAILHGVWLFAAVLLFGAALSAIPMAALAGVLVVIGYRLVSLKHARHLLAHYGPLTAMIWAATLVTVVATDLLTGVLVGIALSLLELVPVARRLKLLVRARPASDDHWRVELAGTATMLQLPQLARSLDKVPPGGAVTIRMRSLRHLDHTCAEYLRGWIRLRRSAGGSVYVGPGLGRGALALAE